VFCRLIENDVLICNFLEVEHEKAKSVKADDAKLEGLRLICNHASQLPFVRGKTSCQQSGCFFCLSKKRFYKGGENE